MASYRWGSWALLLLIVVLPLVSIVEGCFWTTCPIGGKRSASEFRECMACGPEGKGRCAGPNICCQKEGCVIGDMAKECMQEDEGTTVCEVKGIPCGAEGQGRCVADGVCCDTSACSTNSHCGSALPRTSSRRQELLSLLKRLINKVN